MHPNMHRAVGSNVQSPCPGEYMIKHDKRFNYYHSKHEHLDNANSIYTEGEILQLQKHICEQANKNGPERIANYPKELECDKASYY
jgi:hypothetical protein